MGALVVHAPSRAGNYVSSRGPGFVCLATHGALVALSW